MDDFLSLREATEKIMTKKKNPNSIGKIFFLAEERFMIGKFSLMFIFPVVCALAYGNSDLPPPCRGEASAIIQIVTKQTESIQHYDGGKLYLKAEKIYQTNAGPALYNAASMILLPNLSADQTGYYLPCRSKDDYRFTCPNCGKQWWFSDTWDYLCPVCGTPGE
jgi:hypothetical protein